MQDKRQKTWSILCYLRNRIPKYYTGNSQLQQATKEIVLCGLL